MTRVFHPNITEDGAICLSILRQNTLDGFGKFVFKIISILCVSSRLDADQALDRRFARPQLAFY